MAGAFFAGKNGSASVNGVLQYSKKWEATIDSSRIDVTNQQSPSALDGSKWREFLGGFNSGVVTMECVHDPTLAKPVNGAQMAYTLGVGGIYGLAGSMQLAQTRYFTDIEGAAMVAYTGQMTGPPTIV